MTILVTGGCGYIGSHVVKALSEMGEKVVVYDNLSQGSKSALLYNETLVVGDIKDKKNLRQVFVDHDITCVIHLAALVNAAESVEKKAEYYAVNAEGSENVWLAANSTGVKHILYASSAAVYGMPSDNKPIPESSPVSPTNPYGESKLLGEQSLIKYAGDNCSYLIFRFFNVGGAEKEGRLGQSKESRAIMQRLFASALGEEKLVLSGHDYDTKDGTVVRDFVHVEDIAFAFVLGLNYLRGGGRSLVLNLGSGETHSIGEVIKEVEVVTGKSIPIVYGDRIKGDIVYSLADITRAIEILGWEPVHTLRLIVQDGWNSYVQRQNT